MEILCLALELRQAQSNLAAQGMPCGKAAQRP